VNISVFIRDGLVCVEWRGDLIVELKPKEAEHLAEAIKSMARQAEAKDG
jgi:hypothetical protein